MPEDLTKFGLIPEFVGRLPVVGAVSSLGHDALVEILTTPRNSLVKQYTKMFNFEDIDLEFTEEALHAIADLAIKRGTGARGLRAIIESVLLDVMFDVPGARRRGRGSSRCQCGGRWCQARIDRS